MKKVVACIAALLMTPSAHAEGVTILMQLDCSKWFNQATAFGAKAWVMGYLSGVDEIWVSEPNGSIDPLSGLSNEQVFLWMDNYCHANPLSNLRIGAATLFAELAQRRQDEMRRQLPSKK